MFATRLKKTIGWLGLGGVLVLYLLAIYAYGWQPDRLAAFTVMPVWVWGGIGLLASLGAHRLLKSRLCRVVSLLWVVSLFLMADEAKVLTHLGKEPPPLRRSTAGAEACQIRVLTLNCAEFAYNRPGNPIQDITEWQPDVVFLQEVWPGHVKQIADALFHGQGDYRVHKDNGIVTRWKLGSEIRNPDYRDQEVTLLHPRFGEIELLNLHLKTAATDLRLWDRDCWRHHMTNRLLRRKELESALSLLKKSADGRPCILGGDFNSPPSDPLQHLLEKDFRDAYSECGTGWGNTFQRRIPILRIDQLHFTRHFQVVHCAAHTTRKSDHRMVIADFTYSP